MNDLNPNMIRALKSLLPNSIRSMDDVLALDAVARLLGKDLPEPFHRVSDKARETFAKCGILANELRLHLDKLLVESTK